MSNGSTTANFVYNKDGLRVRKTVNGVVTNYTLHGKNVVHMTRGNDDLHFFYDAQGKPAVVVYNGTAYAYVKNLQGDIVGILDSVGNWVVEYTYDAWGAPLSKTGSMAATLGTVNPFRYRGYVYDEETGLYYLRSRYYKPDGCRFLNADTIYQGNIFAYCANQPNNYCDNTGRAMVCAFSDCGFGNLASTMTMGANGGGGWSALSYARKMPSPGGYLPIRPAPSTFSDFVDGLIGCVSCLVSFDIVYDSSTGEARSFYGGVEHETIVGHSRTLYSTGDVSLMKYTLQLGDEVSVSAQLTLFGYTLCASVDLTEISIEFGHVQEDTSYGVYLNRASVSVGFQTRVTRGDGSYVQNKTGVNLLPFLLACVAAYMTGVYSAPTPVPTPVY